MRNQTEPFDYQRYLLSKRSVEERCLSAQVWSALQSHLADHSSRPLRILELGGGVGSMALRFLQSAALPAAHYTIVEASAASLATARSELLPRSGEWTFEFVASDIYAYLDQHPGDRWDLLVAHALLDLLDLPTVLPCFLACLQPGGAFYFPINYDGLSSFAPEGDAEFERQLFAAYHASMDRRQIGGQPSGHSQTGRRLLAALPAAGATILAAGASDWMVFPQDGGYPGDEAFFLECILQTIEAKLGTSPDLDQVHLQRWLAERRAQLARSELVFIAHQVDIFGLAPRVE